MDDEFRLGPSYVALTCCGKPVGCTNTSEACTMRLHPWKRTTCPPPEDWTEEDWRMNVLPKAIAEEDK